MVNKSDFARVVYNLADWGVHGTVIRRLRKPEEDIDKVSNPRVAQAISGLRSSVSSHAMQSIFDNPEQNQADPISQILQRYWINDPVEYLLSDEVNNMEIDTTPRIDWVPLMSSREYDRDSILQRSKDRIPFITKRFRRKK